MVKFYHQGLRMLVKKNRESYLYQSKELEIQLYYKMKVILLENLKKIGSIGEIIDVKRGFARNYLIANKKALYASKENINQVEKIKLELGKKDNERERNAKSIASQINKKEYLIKKL